MPDAFAALLEACMVVVHTSTPCRACGGHGYRELSPDELAEQQRRLDRVKNDYERAHVRRDLARASCCAACKGTGYVTPRRADRATAVDSMWTTSRCSSCRGSGQHDEEPCQRCQGHGYVTPLSARPAGTKDGYLHEVYDFEAVLERPLPAKLPEEDPTMPPFLRLSVVARACHLSTDSTETLLGHMGLLETLGTYKHVRSERLRQELPEVYERLANSGQVATTRGKSGDTGKVA